MAGLEGRNDPGPSFRTENALLLSARRFGSNGDGGGLGGAVLPGPPGVLSRRHLGAGFSGYETLS